MVMRNRAVKFTRGSRNVNWITIGDRFLTCPRFYFEDQLSIYLSFDGGTFGANAISPLWIARDRRGEESTSN